MVNIVVLILVTTNVIVRGRTIVDGYEDDFEGLDDFEDFVDSEDHTDTLNRFCELFIFRIIFDKFEHILYLANINKLMPYISYNCNSS